MAGRSLLLIVVMVTACIHGLPLQEEDIVDVEDAERMADGTFLMPDSEKLMEVMEEYEQEKVDFLDNVVGEGVDLAKKASDLSDGETIQETGTATVNGTEADVNTEISRSDLDGDVAIQANAIARHNGEVVANSTLNVVNGTSGMGIRFVDGNIYTEVGLLPGNVSESSALEAMGDVLRGIASELGIDLSSNED